MANYNTSVTHKRKLSAISSTTKSIKDEEKIHPYAHLPYPAGIVYYRGFLSIEEQQVLVNKCLDLGQQDGGFYDCCNEKSRNMQMMNMGISLKGVRHKLSIPDLFLKTASKIRDFVSLVSEDLPVPEEFDICVVNFYETNATLGLHQDVATRSDPRLAVLSISLGDSADFCFRRSWKKKALERKITLRSGDVMLFGGNSRDIIHGVRRIHAGTAPVGLHMPAGRLNINLRQR